MTNRNLYYKTSVYYACLLLLSTQHTYGWTVGFHTVSAQIAYNSLSSTTKAEVEAILASAGRKGTYFPKASATANDVKVPSGYTSPWEMAKTFSSFTSSSIFPDAIKYIQWHDTALQKKYDRLHYLNTPIDFQRDCREASMVTIAKIKRIGEAEPLNILSGIESAIKTLVVHKTATDAKALDEKDIALRFLIHLMGDLHQPYHGIEPLVNGHPTRGGIYIRINPPITGNYLPSSFVDHIKKWLGLSKTTANNLHLLWDLGLEKVQLPEPYNTFFFPQGATQWTAHHKTYLQYIRHKAVAIQVAYQDTMDPHPPTITGTMVYSEWINEKGTTVTPWLVTCLSKVICLAIEDIAYLHSTADVVIASYERAGVTYPSITFKDFPTYQKENKKKIDGQCYLSGMRLAMLLEAIFAVDDNTVTQASQYVKRIATSKDVPTLAELLAKDHTT